MDSRGASLVSCKSRRLVREVHVVFVRADLTLISSGKAFYSIDYTCDINNNPEVAYVTRGRGICWGYSCNSTDGQTEVSTIETMGDKRTIDRPMLMHAVLNVHATCVSLAARCLYAGSDANLTNPMIAGWNTRENLCREWRQ